MEEHSKSLISLRMLVHLVLVTMSWMILLKNIFLRVTLLSIMMYMVIH